MTVQNLLLIAPKTSFWLPFWGFYTVSQKEVELFFMGLRGFKKLARIISMVIFTLRREKIISAY